MIIFYTEKDLWSKYDDGVQRVLRSYTPRENNGSSVWDTSRVYLSVAENFRSLVGGCGQMGLPKPVQLSEEILKSLPRLPCPLADLTKAPAKAGQTQVRVCLFNGGGGGLGDGILFAPALKILYQFLAGQGYEDIQLDVYSLLPYRTGVVMQGIPGVRVKPFPLTLADFVGYDYFADFSGLLEDEDFQTSHMTDFALLKMGFDSGQFPDRHKEPFLHIPAPEASVEYALAMERVIAQGRPLVAVVFSCTYTRSLPEEKAAELMKKLLPEYRPVVIMPPEIPAAPFFKKYNLAGKVADLSPFSTSFENYMNILAGLDAIISVDTSAVHIGAAFNKPTVALFNSIDKDLRTKYSPSVQVIQLEYEGQSCKAPCGLSKSSAYIQGTLANSTHLRMEFGYSCDEALDKDALLDQAIGEVGKIDYGADIDGQLEYIRKKYLERFGQYTAPCWSRLKSEQVVAVLKDVFRENMGKLPEICPVCLATGKLHRRIWKRKAGQIHCRHCQASMSLWGGETPTFFSGLSGKGSSAMHGEEEKFVYDVLGQVFHNRNPILWLKADGEDKGFLEVPVNVPGVVSATLSEARRAEGEFGAVVVAGAFEDVGNPHEIALELIAKLRTDGIFVLLTRNRDSLENMLGVWQEQCSGHHYISWTPATHWAFLDSLQLEPVWSGCSPLTWSQVKGCGGEVQPLFVSSQAVAGNTVEVSGEDMAQRIQTYVSPLLKKLQAAGRYLLSVGKKCEG